MKYMIISVVKSGNWSHEVVEYVNGQISLEKFTDSRIIAIYHNAAAIYKLYGDSSCVQIA